MPEVRGNSSQLQQVLLNLMLNAGQAMEDSKHRKLRVSSRLTEDAVEIRVADTGPGISNEIKEKLFKPFFTTKRKGKGTGLGLSVSRSIVEAHRGTIRVDSVEGQGATFVIRLPRV